MKKYSPELIEKIAKKLDKSPKYIREQISKKALANNISPEAQLANWARSLKISATPYIGKLKGSDQAQIYSRPVPNNTGVISKPSMLRIVRFGKKEEEDRWYNNAWVQIVFVGIGAGTIAQVLGNWFSKLLGII